MSWLKSIQNVQTQIANLAAISVSGSYNDLSNKPTTFNPPIATAVVLGGVKQGTNLSIDANGVLSLNYTPPVATTLVSGTVKIDGTSITINNGVISGASTYSLPTAAAGTLGGIKVGAGLAIDGSGVLSTAGGGAVTSVAGRTGVITLSATDISNTGLIYDIIGSVFGVPAASQVDVRFYTGRAFVLPTNLAGSIVKSGVAAAASSIFLVQRNNATVATITFASNSSTATFSSQAAISFSIGDKFAIVAPAVADATLADIDFFLMGTLA